MSKNLYIVATPIGNLADISYRAIEILRSVDLILCENTKHSKILLDHYHISCALKPLHEHNEHRVVGDILQLLETKNIALISDAGTPLISDPGYILVSKARKQGIDVVPIPGASSVISALSVAGLPSDAFCFTGFLPTKAQAKTKYLHSLQYATLTTICFESPKRILDTLTQMSVIFTPERVVSIAKELTKRFETIKTGTTLELLEFFTADELHTRGEFVILISPNTSATTDYQNISHILKVLGSELPKSQAAKITAKLTGMTKAQCYEMLIESDHSKTL